MGKRLVARQITQTPDSEYTANQSSTHEVRPESFRGRGFAVSATAVRGERGPKAIETAPDTERKRQF
ncbi:hypothetical protein J8I87_41065 [Paraburkholderia sp. LEh10]|uniref:hypothetical protein n=1 Tax=Paraburkholderia sp. LEh10 TaxID=2821353 RepID=UPI001AE5ED2B|nr:hypothetical protein [Paraburkholderia sp. LEh10]MBP0595901.1 hypothetical protein [Paraburkholderia sp. LEh10]